MQPRHQHELQRIHKDTREEVDKRIAEAGTPFEGAAMSYGDNKSGSGGTKNVKPLT